MPLRTETEARRPTGRKANQVNWNHRAPSGIPFLFFFGHFGWEVICYFDATVLRSHVGNMVDPVLGFPKDYVTQQNGTGPEIERKHPPKPPRLGLLLGTFAGWNIYVLFIILFQAEVLFAILEVIPFLNSMLKKNLPLLKISTSKMFDPNRLFFSENDHKFLVNLL